MLISAAADMRSAPEFYVKYGKTKTSTKHGQMIIVFEVDCLRSSAFAYMCYIYDGPQELQFCYRALGFTIRIMSCSLCDCLTVLRVAVFYTFPYTYNTMQRHFLLRTYPQRRRLRHIPGTRGTVLEENGEQNAHRRQSDESQEEGIMASVEKTKNSRTASPSLQLRYDLHFQEDASEKIGGKTKCGHALLATSSSKLEQDLLDKKI
jgi:hypothetical protein